MTSSFSRRLTQLGASNTDNHPEANKAMHTAPVAVQHAQDNLWLVWLHIVC